MNRVVHLVLVYHREHAALLLKESFADRDGAMRRRFELERPTPRPHSTRPTAGTS